MYSYLIRILFLLAAFLFFRSKKIKSLTKGVVSYFFACLVGSGIVDLIHNVIEYASSGMSENNISSAPAIVLFVIYICFLLEFLIRCVYLLYLYKIAKEVSKDFDYEFGISIKEIIFAFFDEKYGYCGFTSDETIINNKEIRQYIENRLKAINGNKIDMAYLIVLGYSISLTKINIKNLEICENKLEKRNSSTKSNMIACIKAFHVNVSDEIGYDEDAESEFIRHIILEADIKNPWITVNVVDRAKRAAMNDAINSFEYVDKKLTEYASLFKDCLKK